MSDPGKIIVAGDWHGDTIWARKVIRQAPEVLAGEDRRLILQLGDYGIWPGTAGVNYRADVGSELAEQDAEVWFADGNHEWHPYLTGQQERWSGLAAILVGGRQIWLTRGCRWSWHDRAWVAVGGAVSLDRAIRTEGKNWWPGEEISDEQEAAIIAGGKADVMVSHDVPAGVRHSFPPPPSFWDSRDLARNDAHRERMQRITNALQPSHIIHGHLHRAYTRTCDFGYGPVQVTGLDMNGTKGNWAVLDTRAMTWEAP